MVTHNVKLVQGSWKYERPGRAVAAVEADKKKTYTPGPSGQPVWMVPVAMGTGGRLGIQCSAELSNLAREYAVRANCRLGSLSGRFRRQPSCLDAETMESSAKLRCTGRERSNDSALPWDLSPSSSQEYRGHDGPGARENGRAVKI